MPGAENLIKKIGYSVPESIKCKYPWPFHGSYPCGIRWRNHTIGIYGVFTYPTGLDPVQLATIYTCASTAIAAVYFLFATASVVCGDPLTAGGCQTAINTAVSTANPVLRTTFKGCIDNLSGLPSNVKRECDIGIITREV